MIHYVWVVPPFSQTQNRQHTRAHSTQQPWPRCIPQKRLHLVVISHKRKSWRTRVACLESVFWHTIEPMRPQPLCCKKQISPSGITTLLLLCVYVGSCHPAILWNRAPSSPLVSATWGLHKIRSVWRGFPVFLSLLLFIKTAGWLPALRKSTHHHGI